MCLQPRINKTGENTCHQHISSVVLEVKSLYCHSPGGDTVQNLSHYIISLFLQKIFTPNLDKLLTIKRETYKARAGNHHSIFVKPTCSERHKVDMLFPEYVHARIHA